jgi:hypothetical protein
MVGPSTCKLGSQCKMAYSQQPCPNVRLKAEFRDASHKTTFIERVHILLWNVPSNTTNLDHSTISAFERNSKQSGVTMQNDIFCEEQKCIGRESNPGLAEFRRNR